MIFDMNKNHSSEHIPSSRLPAELKTGIPVIHIFGYKKIEIVNYLGITESHMYKLTSGGKIPHYKPTGKLIYFSRSELDDWLLHNRVFNEIDQDNEQNRHIDQESE